MQHSSKEKTDIKHLPKDSQNWKDLDLMQMHVPDYKLQITNYKWIVKERQFLKVKTTLVTCK